jgi:hypothetical protein
VTLPDLLAGHLLTWMDAAADGAPRRARRSLDSGLLTESRSTRSAINQTRRSAHWVLVNPPATLVLEVAELVAVKDAPIVAAAKRSNIDEQFGITVATPDEVLTRLQA